LDAFLQGEKKKKERVTRSRSQQQRGGVKDRVYRGLRERVSVNNGEHSMIQNRGTGWHERRMTMKERKGPFAGYNI